jgi:hypothetical protein
MLIVIDNDYIPQRHILVDLCNVEVLWVFLFCVTDSILKYHLDEFRIQMVKSLSRCPNLSLSLFSSRIFYLDMCLNEIAAKLWAVLFCDLQVQKIYDFVFVFTRGCDTTFFRLLSLGASIFIRSCWYGNKIHSGSLLFFTSRDKILRAVSVA